MWVKRNGAIYNSNLIKEIYWTYDISGNHTVHAEFVDGSIIELDDHFNKQQAVDYIKSLEILLNGGPNNSC